MRVTAVILVDGPPTRSLVIVGACGFDAETAVAVDGDGYYSPPAPRLADGIRQLAYLCRPGAVPDPGLPAILLGAGARRVVQARGVACANLVTAGVVVVSEVRCDSGAVLSNGAAHLSAPCVGSMVFPAARMADAQVPWGVGAPSGIVGEAAWRSTPSWYLVAADDRMIPPPAQRTMAERIGATVTETPGSHAVYVSDPAEVAGLIAQAARSAARETAAVA